MLDPKARYNGEDVDNDDAGVFLFSPLSMGRPKAGGSTLWMSDKNSTDARLRKICKKISKKKKFLVKIFLKKFFFFFPKSIFFFGLKFFYRSIG